MLYLQRSSSKVCRIQVGTDCAYNMHALSLSIYIYVNKHQENQGDHLPKYPLQSSMTAQSGSIRRCSGELTLADYKILITMTYC